MTATAEAAVKPRTVVLAAAFALAAVVLALVSLSLGTTKLPLDEVLRALVGGGDSGTRLIVVELRMPRVATGLLVGIAFAVSGALLQTLSRNPLASPDIIGVNSGASAAAVGVIVLAGTGGGNISGAAEQIGLPLAAVLGGLLATLIVGLLSIQRGVVDASKVVLIGVGVAAAANSLVAWLLVIGDVTDAGRAAAWLAGSLNARTWSDAVPVGLAVALLLPVAMMFGRELEALVLGDDVASSLGVRVSRVRLALLVVATVLAAMATAGAGPIAFVALVAPQVAQRLARTDRPPLLTTAMLGALFVTLADLVARNGLQVLQVGPYELPVGVVTAAAGAPYLLHLIGRQQKGR
ncbi:iron complex transport system permease protein [Kribbella voronezhensis]|uniref:Iron complex transport system permease protein n=1 Tax=Kribbella voronezhensis TaxID=2512212 RepID=A0A4R7THQ0_9ACTN|nr:iron ABC transporter permease [Kribbella voronezhensis]TDU91851.1 iron complex transport system permease protein [Kribbella voronezhensis]